MLISDCAALTLLDSSIAGGDADRIVGLGLGARLEAQQPSSPFLQVRGRRIDQLDAIDLRDARAEPCGTTDTVPSLPMVTWSRAE
jgi:hypothetical protein